MANFVLEDTSGHCEGVCFKYDDFADALEQDAIVKVRGKFEHSDRGDQIMAFEVERLAFDASQIGPSQLEIRLWASEMNALRSQQLQQILHSHPGDDAVVLFIRQADGRKFRAELPLGVNVASQELLRRIEEIVGQGACQLV